MGPILCNYYVTYRCNAKCGFCDIWEQPSPMVDLADVEANLRDCKRLGVKVVDFTGGEPLLHTQLHEMLALAKDLGLMTTVTTNGLLYPKRAEQLRGLVDLLHFSIDSADREAHNASRGVNCYDKLMESIEVALSLGENPDLLFTVTNENVDQLSRIYYEISRPNDLVLIINPLFDYNSLGEELTDEVMKEMKEFGSKPYTYLNPSFLTLRRQGGNDPEDPTCKAASTCVVISPFNELVLPCYHYGLDKLPIEKDLHRLWHSDTVKYHQEMEGRHEVCEGCTINCYFEPSFGTSPEMRYFWEGLSSKARYGWTKFVVQRLRSRLSPSRAATLPDFASRPAARPASNARPTAARPASEMIDLPVVDP